ncbi:6957_t:CDS:1 [Funneliformis mosseae]|uniref:DNA polymerase delta subunit 3 n=1 Tax=Funneliformis mosseae TaxID=27381 RepID=A0A9N9H3G3_FUNMO|nr:6957_t:CDS:1 [Funneliformis mosseae]
MTIIEQLEIIKQLVLKERKIVTYEWLSKYLNIHVNEAKPLLYKFVSEYGSSNKESFYTVYCISGFSTINDQHTVTLIYQENLENIRKDFSKVSSLHVYSVQPKCPTEAELVKANQGSIDKVSTEPVLPSNTNREVTLTVNKKESSNTSIKPDEKESEKVNPTQPEISKPNTVTIKSAFSKEKQLINKQNDDSHLGKATSHEIETSKEEQEDRQSEGKQFVNQKKNDKTEDNVPQDESKTSNKKSKKRKSDECESNLDEASKEGRVNNKQKSKENKVTYKNKIAKARKKNKVADDLDLQNTTEKFMTIMTIDNAEKDQPQEKQSAVSASPDQQSALPTKKRGRRQTLKFRSYVNEKGYTVRENYHEWESFSEDESVLEPPAKKSQKAIKAQEPKGVAKRVKKKKGDNGSQKSLLNFFGKK